MTRRTRIAIVATLFLVAYMVVIWMLIPPPARSLSPRPQPATGEKKAFKARLVHHGLQHTVSVVHGWPEDPYFIRAGKRCKF